MRYIPVLSIESENEIANTRLGVASVAALVAISQKPNTKSSRAQIRRPMRRRQAAPAALRVTIWSPGNAFTASIARRHA